MKKLFIYSLICTGIFLNAKDFDTLNLSYTKYDSNSKYSDGTVVDFDKYTYNLTYLKSLSNFLIRVRYKELPNQKIASTVMNGVAIDVEQEISKLEIGGAYKYFISDSTYIGPALSYETLDNSTKQILANGATIKSDSLDTDLRAFIVLGTRFSKLNSLFASLELENDLKSNDKEKDFNHYSLSTTFNQIISRQLYLSASYSTLLRKQDTTATQTGKTRSQSFEFGIGYIF